jgi:peptidoglycan/xylan/chitin deacetylase (PgdA/CDA1 family)
MKSFWKNNQTHFVVYFYLILDKLRFSKNYAQILMFHHVTDDKVDASPICLSSVAQFTQVLEYLKKNKIKVVSIEDALTNIKKNIFRGYAVITFDDGLEDTFKIAYPLLKNYNFPFTIYITLNYLNEKGYLTIDQLNILKKDPLCTLGAHTLSHSVLKTAENSREEIVQSRVLLEKIINKKVLHFAIPYGGPGSISIKNIFEIKNAGYKSAVSSIGARLNYLSTLNKFFLPRVNGSLFPFDDYE